MKIGFTVQKPSIPDMDPSGLRIACHLFMPQKRRRNGPTGESICGTHFYAPSLNPN